MFLILLLLLGFLTFVTYIWLVVTAFKKSVLWGLLVLFLSPVTAIIFGIIHWKDAKIPFLTFILTNAVYFALMFHVVTQVMDSTGFMEIAEKVQRGENITEEEMAEKMLAIAENMAENGLISQQGLQLARQEVNKQFPQLQKNKVREQQPTSPEPSLPSQPIPANGAVSKVEPAPRDSLPQPDKTAKPTSPTTPKPETAAAAKVDAEPQEDMSQSPAPEEAAAPDKPAETEAAPAAEPETKQATTAAADTAKAEIEAPPPAEEIEKVIEEVEKQEEKSPASDDRKSKQTLFRKISLREAGNYIGKKVKIIDKRGKVHTGRLEKVESSRIILGKLTGLIYSYDIQNVAIKTVMVER